jgi:hypothetical protein
MTTASGPVRNISSAMPGVCDICGAAACVNPSFCALSRKADVRLRAQKRNRPDRKRPTPQTTIEAIMVCVRGRGIGALEEPANLERLSRCDEAARAQINHRIARLIEQKGLLR